jgi:uncharacterized SAM-binding protein YcdF (DUF218 family)
MSNSMEKRTPRKIWRRALVPAIGALAVILLIVGFFSFAEDIAKATTPSDPHADAIVVLTGDSPRIEEAFRLLNEGRAARLLISGVNPSVTDADLAKIVDGDLRGQLDCCVDLGRKANDTVGNATETRNWVEEHGFASLIVVTSDYHMPRSMTELSGAMPTVALIPFPVSNPNFHFSDWWHDPTTLTLLVREYGKYLLAKARRLLPGEPGAHAG